MLTVQEIIDEADDVEIRHLQDKEEADTIIKYINQAVLEIAKEFTILTKPYDLELNESQTMYDLPDDCLVVAGVFDEGGNRIPINDENTKESVFTPDNMTLLVPYPEDGAFLTIVYSARPPKAETVNDTIRVSHTFLLPILSFIGYRASKAIGTSDEGVKANLNEFYGMLEKIKDNGSINMDDVNSQTFCQRGFV